tara:strand:+ start:1044 stop:1283 length:240 start_codon:yes stop_codon:yes gene_type:complete
MQDPDESLVLVPTTALIQELTNRHDDMVLMAAQHRSTSFDDVTVCFGGSLHGNLGLLEVARQAILNGIGGPDDEENSIN